MEKTIGSNLALLGSATLIKLNLDLESPDYPEDPRYFTDEDLGDLEKIPGVVTVTPSVYSWWPTRLEFDATYRNRKFTDVRIMGVESSFFKLVGHLPMREGRTIDEADSRLRRNVCVIGRGVKDYLFERDESPVGRTVFVQGLGLEVVGLIGEADDTMFDEVIMMPIPVARARISGMYSIRRLTVLPAGLDCVEAVGDQVIRLLKSKRPMYKYRMNIDRERLEVCRNILRIFKLFVYTAIFATLLLSSIGIANVMLAMVRERTSEIGLRKAVGATDKDIASQFLLESILVSFMSSALGMMMGSLLVITVSLAVWRSLADLKMLVLALAASAAIGGLSGTASGLLPARTATRMDPLVAMRFE